MNLRARLAWMFVGSLSQHDLLRLTSDLFDRRLSGMSGEEQLAFLQRLVEENLECALAGLDRPQRARLMNDLLPLIARHFPLDDVDILGAFGGLEEAAEPDWEGL